MSPYEVVIGLEVHAQLSTKTKLFCGCSTAFGAAPNVHTCAVCLGLPGALPVLNKAAVELAITAALGLGCTVHPRAQWSRKNYFYPDLPKGYQITQFDQPLATGGGVNFDDDGTPRRVNLTRIHMEEDAGKNVHDDVLAGSRSYVDFNRGGTPLIEIVSEPDLRSAAAAASYLKALRQILRYLGVCDGNMEEGSLRCDANVSLRRFGAAKLGTRAELKNINSFRFVTQALEFEIHRQTQLLDAGDKVVQETRLYDSQAKATRSMRSKEEAHDYRYFADPNLPDLCIDAATLQAARAVLPELPSNKQARYVQSMGLSDYDARVLTDDAEVASFFEEALRPGGSPKAVANWVINELLREIKGRSIATVGVGGAHLGELVVLIEQDVISGRIAKDVFAAMLRGEGAPSEIVKRQGLAQVSDAGAVAALVDKVLAEQAESVEKYLAGRTNVMGFLVGQVIKQSGGKANPKLVNEMLRDRLRKP